MTNGETGVEGSTGRNKRHEVDRRFNTTGNMSLYIFIFPFPLHSDLLTLFISEQESL